LLLPKVKTRRECCTLFGCSSQIVRRKGTRQIVGYSTDAVTTLACFRLSGTVLASRFVWVQSVLLLLLSLGILLIGRMCNGCMYGECRAWRPHALCGGGVGGGERGSAQRAGHGVRTHGGRAWDRAKARRDGVEDSRRFRMRKKRRTISTHRPVPCGLGDGQVPLALFFPSLYLLLLSLSSLLT